MSSDSNKKYKRPKQKTLATTNPEPTTSQATVGGGAQAACPLLAKDSEWVDILQGNEQESAKSTTNISDEEEVLQLVDTEDGPEMKPLAIMFPGILEKDPQTLQGMLNKAMSTTEVTKHLVDLGQKANFTFMKKADRLIPPEKQWLESVTENSNSISSFISGQISIRSSNREASDEQSLSDKSKPKKTKKLTKSGLKQANNNFICEGSPNRKASNEQSLSHKISPKKKKQKKCDIKQSDRHEEKQNSNQDLNQDLRENSEIPCSTKTHKHE